ncbi:hypothetical protein GCM10027261_41870 [Geodermatophilus arenarius]|uniref:Uncharacterized protein n=1 Tax=Geodermatophilus arenarius TaxID=1137990 RepID=A0ABV9LMI0_9ACTN
MAEVRPEDRIRDDATGTPPAPGSGAAQAAAERVVQLPANPRRTRRA